MSKDKPTPDDPNPDRGKGPPDEAPPKGKGRQVPPHRSSANRV